MVIIVVMLLAAGLAALARAFVMINRLCDEWELPSQECVRCRYNLGGLAPNAPCPECGEPLPHRVVLAADDPRVRRNISLTVGVAGGIPVLIGVLGLNERTISTAAIGALFIAIFTLIPFVVVRDFLLRAARFLTPAHGVTLSLIICVPMSLVCSAILASAWLGDLDGAQLAVLFSFICIPTLGHVLLAITFWLRRHARSLRRPDVSTPRHPSGPPA